MGSDWRGLACRELPGVVSARVPDLGGDADEIARRLPGDELLASADIVSTRAVTIDAPPSAVWPWLVQRGPDRRLGSRADAR